jgi:hypothetical protein
MAVYDSAAGQMSPIGLGRSQGASSSLIHHQKKIKNLVALNKSS